MTTEQYRVGASLAEVFLELVQSGMSPAEAAEDMSLRYRAFHFRVEEEMPSCRFLAGADGELIIETFDAALGRVDPSSAHIREPTAFDPVPIPLATMAALDAERKKVVMIGLPQSPAAQAPKPLLNSVTLPAPVQPSAPPPPVSSGPSNRVVSEGARNRIKKAAETRAEAVAALIEARRKQVAAAQKKYPHYGAKALAEKLGLPRTTVRSDLKALSGHAVKP